MSICSSTGVKHPYGFLALAFLAFSFTARSASAQLAAGSLGSSPLALILANSYSKEVSLYRSKQFIINQILSSEKGARFEAYPLAAATSGELTTLVYRCEDPQRQGLLMAFYGNQWNPAGVVYQAYGFKDLPAAKATDMLEKLDAFIAENTIYLRMSTDGHNAYFKYDDLTILVYSPDGVLPKVRVFWGEFDAEWNISAFNKTHRRLLKKM